MDGSYIPDENIVEGTNDKNIYTDEQIVTSKVHGTIIRNHQKQEILNRMTGLNKVWGSIPYSVHYFSCNMDHVLHNEANLSRVEKYSFSTEFENEYFGKPDKFTAFFNSEEFAVRGDYLETWDFIKDGTNSLKRYSNLNQYLNKKAK